MMLRKICLSLAFILLPDFPHPTPHHHLEVSSIQALSHVQLFVNPWNVASEGSSVDGILQARILEWVAIYHAIYFTFIYLPYHALNIYFESI